MDHLAPDFKMDTPQTPAEREREKSLLDDPYARVLSPSSVQCRQCLKEIKLSTKSAYDTFHWKNHRTRCLRAMRKKIKAAEVHAKRSGHFASLSSASSSRKIVKRPKRPKTPTPPLVTDSDDDRPSVPSPKVQSPAAPRGPLPRFPPPLQTYTACYAPPSLEEGMLRSHPECVQVSAPATDHGRNWSWSQLKQRSYFSAPIYYDNGDDGDDDERKPIVHSFGRSVVDADDREQEAARTLSALSHSR